MKVISLEDAKTRLPAIFEEALAGEIIRFRSPDGAELELTRVQKIPGRSELSADELAEAYNDPERAAFENNCGRASNQQTEIAPWEIRTYDFPIEGSHPCVIFTNAARLAHPDFDRINVLLCRTLRGPVHRPLKPVEVFLDRADGLDWETICRVGLLHSVAKTGLRDFRGLVSFERRRLISQRIYSFFRFQP